MFDVAKLGVLALCLVGSLQAGQKVHKAAAPLQSKLTLGKPVQVGTLCIVPIESAVPLARDEYLTLAEATKIGMVEIVEMPGQEEVNTLEVRNKSKLPILLFAGELLLGGKQDRIVAKDSIVPGHERRDVPVFCVEHNRWEGKPVFSGGDTLVPNEVRGAALSTADQSVVWSRVAESNAKVAASPMTGTIRGTLDSPKLKKASSQLLTTLNSKFVPTSKTVGVICWINGKIESADIYANANLFAQSRSKLFHSYSLDAGILSNPKVLPVDLKKCQAFLSQIVTARRQVAAHGMDGNSFSVQNRDLIGYESGNRKFNGASPMGGGGRGGASGAGGFGHGTYKPGDAKGGN